MALARDLEKRIEQLNTPNTEDPRFSNGRFILYPDSIDSRLTYLKRDLIVIKVSGKLLLDETEPGEKLTKRDYLVQTMALLSQLGLNVFLIHGGQEQLDRAITASILGDDVKGLSMLKNGEIRYTSQDIMPLVVSTSNRLSDGLKKDILSAGGNANAYLSSLFIGIRRQHITVTDPQTQETYSFHDNNFGYLPLDARLKVVQGEGQLGREGRVLRYLRGGLDNRNSAPGHIIIRGFLVNYADPANARNRKVDIRARQYEDPFVLNGDADNVATAHAFYFADREVIPIRYDGKVNLVRPRMVHVIEIARNGGLRAGPDPYDPLVRIVSHESDLKKYDIERGMEGKAKNSLRAARALGRKGALYAVKIMHIRELLPYLFGNEEAIREGYGTGFGTTFAPGGLKAYAR